MKNNLIKIFILFVMASFIPACNSNLELEPQNSLDASVGFKTKQDVEAALLGCYNSLQSGNYYGLRSWALADVYADILQHTGTFPSFAQFANRNILADNVEVSNMWNVIYSAINRANTVIAAAPGVNDPSFNVNNALGEARLLRSLHYFTLMIMYGGSPSGFNKADGLGLSIFDKPTLSAADAAPKARSSEADVWKLIMDDVNFAVANLATSNGNGRVNKNVANALKARYHLYRNEWADAEAAATAVIDAKVYTLLSSAAYADIWLKQNTSEAIFELQFDVNNTNSIAFFYYTSATGGRNEITTLGAFRDAHEAGDVRRAVNATTTTPTNKTMKYTRVAGTDNMIIVRFAEMYLIRAEARAMQNKFVDALADLNVIRTRAGLPPSAAATQTALVDAILKERRFEFAHEGHRWFDLRRTNRWNTLSGLTEPNRARWPIPQREVQTAGDIVKQNPGY